MPQLKSALGAFSAAPTYSDSTGSTQGHASCEPGALRCESSAHSSCAAHCGPDGDGAAEADALPDADGVSVADDVPVAVAVGVVSVDVGVPDGVVVPVPVAEPVSDAGTLPDGDRVTLGAADGVAGAGQAVGARPRYAGTIGAHPPARCTQFQSSHASAAAGHDGGPGTPGGAGAGGGPVSRASGGKTMLTPSAHEMRDAIPAASDAHAKTATTRLKSTRFAGLAAPPSYGGDFTNADRHHAPTKTRCTSTPANTNPDPTMKVVVDFGGTAAAINAPVAMKAATKAATSSARSVGTQTGNTHSRTRGGPPGSRGLMRTCTSRSVAVATVDAPVGLRVVTMISAGSSRISFETPSAPVYSHDLEGRVIGPCSRDENWAMGGLEELANTCDLPNYRTGTTETPR